jgi:hypothetical protein
VSYGFVTASWNAWIEANGGNPTLAGIPVRKLTPFLNKNDFYACEDPDRRRRREEQAAQTECCSRRAESQTSKACYGACRGALCQSFTEVRAIARAKERLTARYFTA